jgi:5-hydroxyisourate hydrolase-like protein (transthyretin family)
VFISKKTLRILVLPCSLLLSTVAALGATITGVVTDRTTGKPSAGDTIAVINTAQGMDEIAKTTSDAQGRFSVAAPNGGQILLHITHSGADYFKSVPPGSGSADIDVYDSAKKIDGINGKYLVLRLETDAAGKTLNVGESFIVDNDSAPQRTEYGGNTFDFYLPKGAQVMQTLASAPGGLATDTPVKAIDAASGHYAFTFPIRPGQTSFQVSYTLPYAGKLPFSLKLSMPTGDVAVMVAKTMQFQGPAMFQPVSDPEITTPAFIAHQPAFAQPILFTISGSGQLPEAADTAQGGSQGGGDQSGNGGAADQTTASGPRPGGGLGAPEDPNAVNDPWAKYKWWIISGLGLALVAGAGIMLKNSPAVGVAGAAPMPSGDVSAPPAEFASSVATAPAAVSIAGASALLQALKDELLELETDRLTGRLSEAQYAEQKAAFDVVLRRALNRG